eukprot:30525-Pelagococcus_subviridis.AAC.2
MSFVRQSSALGSFLVQPFVLLLLPLLAPGDDVALGALPRAARSPPPSAVVVHAFEVQSVRRRHRRRSRRVRRPLQQVRDVVRG